MKAWSRPGGHTCTPHLALVGDENPERQKLRVESNYNIQQRRGPKREKVGAESRPASRSGDAVPRQRAVDAAVE